MQEKVPPSVCCIIKRFQEAWAACTRLQVKQRKYKIVSMRLLQILKSARNFGFPWRIYIFISIQRAKLHSESGKCKLPDTADR